MQFCQIKETCLYVSNLEATKQFYFKKLGLELISYVKDNHVFFRVGTSVLLCFLPEVTKKKNHLPPHYGSGQIHLAFEVKVNEYEQWKNRIKSLNIPIEHEEEWNKGLKSFYFRDPDDHLLEIVQIGMWERA